MSDERGQALVVAILLAAMSAVAVMGLGVVSDLILADARDRRAGEAAVAAAGAAVSDLLSAREAALGRVLEPADVARLAAEPVTSEAAWSAARRLAREHGRPEPTDLRVLPFRYEIEVRVTLSGRQHVALIGYEP